MVMKPPAPASQPTAREFHDRRCFLLGIDRAKWGALWEEKRAAAEAAEKAATFRPGNRHGREG
jgi:hypothetical protein